MARQATRSGLSSSDLSDGNSSSESTTEQQPQQTRLSEPTRKKDSIKNYVTNVLHRHGGDHEQADRLAQSQIRIDPRTGGGASRRTYENVSAFRQYHSNAEGIARTDAQQRYNQSSTSDDDDLRHASSKERVKTIDKSSKIFLSFLISQEMLMNHQQN